jgi:hypothetical protein
MNTITSMEFWLPNVQSTISHFAGSHKKTGGKIATGF